MFVFLKSIGLLDRLYLLLKRLRFLINFFFSQVSKEGSDGRISFVLFGM